VIATVDVARLRYRSLPDWLCGMTPQDVLVELRGDQPLLWDLAPAPFPVTWTELAEARAGVRSAKHRLVVAEPPDGPVDLAGAAAAGMADTWAGMLEPPMRNFGMPGLGKWAELLTDAATPRAGHDSWPRLGASSSSSPGCTTGSRPPAPAAGASAPCTPSSWRRRPGRSTGPS